MDAVFIWYTNQSLSPLYDSNINICGWYRIEHAVSYACAEKCSTSILLELYLSEHSVAFPYRRSFTNTLWADQDPEVFAHVYS